MERVEIALDFKPAISSELVVLVSVDRRDVANGHDVRGVSQANHLHIYPLTRNVVKRADVAFREANAAYVKLGVSLVKLL